MQMGLREANQQFSKLVRALRRGQSVTLTDRGRPLAVVEPVAKAARAAKAQTALTSRDEAWRNHTPVSTVGYVGPSAEEVEAALAAMAAEGLVRRATNPGAMRRRPWYTVPNHGKSIVETIMEEREERF